MSLLNLNISTFSLLISPDGENLTILNVSDILSVDFKELPPVAICSGDMQVTMASIGLDVQGVVLVSASYCPGRLMEIPDLGSSVVPSLEHKVVTKSINELSALHFGDHVEVCIN